MGSESRAAWGGALAQGAEAAGTLMLHFALASVEAAACLGGDQGVEGVRTRGVVDAQGAVCIVQALEEEEEEEEIGLTAGVAAALEGRRGRSRCVSWQARAC